MQDEIWTPARARGWLEALQRRGMVLGLERVETLAARLGYPQNAYPSILIAGTNGKGSVAAILDTILAGAGYRVGRNTSPHLIDWPERITVAGHPIAEPEFAAALQTVEEAAGTTEVTPFEAVTLAAFWHFRQRRIHWGVVEVGLGGRLDATRICRAALTVVTAVGLDHVKELGTDLQGIAREKGAICRPGAPLILGPGTAPVRATLEAQAADAGTEAVRSETWVDVTATADTRWGMTGTARWKGVAAESALAAREPAAFEWKLPLAGEHMVNNLTTALATVAALRRAGFRITTWSILQGLESVRWPGRLQCIPGPVGRPELLLDVGHNPMAADSVARELMARAQGRPRNLVVALASDKDLEGFLAPLLPGTGLLVATRWPSPRARDPEEVAAAARRAARSRGIGLTVETAADPVEAVGRAMTWLGGDGLVLVIGSHMLVGPVLDALKRAEGRQRLWPT